MHLYTLKAKTIKIGSYAGDVEVFVELSDGLSGSLDLGTKTVSISVDSNWVNGLINNKLAVADALIFKGVVNTPTPAGSTGLPGVTGYKPGWTYKVGTAGTYAGISEAMICLLQKLSV